MISIPDPRLSSLGLALALAAPVHAQDVPELWSLGSTSPVGLPAGSRLGGGSRGLELEGDLLVLGAQEDFTGVGAPVGGNGSVYLFDRAGDGWSPAGSLHGENAGDIFGHAVELDGDILAVGAPYYDLPGFDSAGAVYMYARDAGTWNLEQVITLDDPSPWGILGVDSVRIDGERLLVGEYGGYTPTGAKAGNAYVFAMDGGQWVQEAKLSSPDGADDDRFGGSLDLVDGVAVLGAPRHDPGTGARAGAAYVFEQVGSSWVQTQKLVPSDSAPYSLFGHGVDIEGDWLFVGSHQASGPAQNTGAVYVFQRLGGAWVESQRLTASNPTDCLGFGKSVCGDGGRLLVSARSPHDGLPGSPAPTGTACAPADAHGGAAWLFELEGGVWTEVARFAPSEELPESDFGYEGFLQGDEVLISAPRHDGVAEDAGMVFHYRLGDSLLGQSGDAISLSAGGDLEFQLDGDPTHAGSPYLLLGTSAGTWPGLAVDGAVLPLDPAGPYFLRTLQNPNQPPLKGSFGTLDANGDAQAYFSVLPGTAPSAAGITLHHAFAVLDPATGPLLASTSNPAPLHLLP